MDFKQVSFLPWFNLHKIVKLGPITFWPYYKETFQRICDSEIKAHLDKYFKCYIDHAAKPVDTITICSYNNLDFSPLSDTEYQQLRNAVDALLFASIVPQVERGVCNNNQSWGPPSANIFELVTQNFQPGDDNVAVQAGSLKSVGWRMQDITFAKPWAKGGAPSSPNEALLKEFEVCFSNNHLYSLSQRVFRSLEWFRFSHIEGGDISTLSKLVMMSTAFEILLQFPPDSKRNFFVKVMEEKIATDKYLKDNRTGNKGKTYTHSLAGWWAWDYYEIRNQIVHGDPISTDRLIYKDWITHLIVADLVFLQFMQQELLNHKCFDDDLQSEETNVDKILDKLFPDEPQGRTIRKLPKRIIEFGEAHRSLGWLE